MFKNPSAKYQKPTMQVILPDFLLHERSDLARSTNDLFFIASQLRGAGFETDALMVDAVCAGLSGNVYDVNENIYQWFTCNGDRLKFDANYEHHAITLRFDRSPTSITEDIQAEILEQLIREYCKDNGRNDRLACFIEGCVIAIVRNHGRNDCFSSAKKLLLDVATVLSDSIHMRAVKHVISCKLQGINIASHLEKFIGDDSGILADRFCEVPFSRMDIDGNGDVRICCAHWVPTTIGNIFTDSTEEIMNSEVVKKIRKSVVDGTFKYCNHVDCELMTNDKLPRKSEYNGKGLSNEFYDISAERLQAALHHGDYSVDKISYIIYGLDQTCNLSCPSCRSDVIRATREECERFIEVTETTVIPMLRQAKRIMINPAGEPFVSRPSRHILKRINCKTFPTLKIDLITNGTVCSKEEWVKFKNLKGMIDIIRVSVDAATQDTFEKLRRGAKYIPFVSNMLNLAQMHREGFMNQFYISFTYQIDNYLEMDRFVDFGCWLGVSTVIFERLQNLGAFSGTEYDRKAVHLVSHPEFPIFHDVVSRLKSDSSLCIDFDPGYDAHSLSLSERMMRALFSRFNLDLYLVLRTAEAAGVDPFVSFSADVPLSDLRDEELYLRHRISLIQVDCYFQNKLIVFESALQNGLMIVGGLPENSLSLRHVVLDRDDFYGLGWGRAESNNHGQAWRWLFGGKMGRSTVYGRVIPGWDYWVRLKIHDAPIDEYLGSLRLEVNGKSVKKQYIENCADGIYHVSKIKKKTVKKMDGWLSLTYTTSAPANALPGEKGISASILELHPTV